MTNENINLLWWLLVAVDIGQPAENIHEYTFYPHLHNANSLQHYGKLILKFIANPTHTQ